MPQAAACLPAAASERPLSPARRRGFKFKLRASAGSGCSGCRGRLGLVARGRRASRPTVPQWLADSELEAAAAVALVASTVTKKIESA